MLGVDETESAKGDCCILCDCFLNLWSLEEGRHSNGDLVELGQQMRRENRYHTNLAKEPASVIANCDLGVKALLKFQRSNRCLDIAVHERSNKRAGALGHIAEEAKCVLPHLIVIHLN